MDVISIKDFPGIRIGNAQNIEGGTGCTVILSESGMSAGAVLLRGKANFSSRLPMHRRSMPYFSEEAVHSGWMPAAVSCSFWKKRTSVLM